MSRHSQRRSASPPKPGARKPAPERGPARAGLERRLPWLLLATLAIMIVIVFASYLSLGRVYLFTDIGSDTLNNFYPQRALVADTLRRFGSPGWSFSQGMGQNIAPNSLGDPFVWPLYALGAHRLAYAIAWIEALKILIAGGLFFALLRLRRASPLPAVLFAACYAFCAAMIVGGGWWSLMSNQVVHAALLLVAYELMLERRLLWPLPLAVAVIAAFNPFDVYLLGVLLLIYAVARHAADDRPAPAPLAVLLLRTAGLAALGLLLSAAASLPTGLEMLQSPRIAGQSGLAGSLSTAAPFHLGDLALYATEALRALGSDLLGTGSEFRGWTNYLEAPLLYAGLLPLLLLPQLWVATPRRRWLAPTLLAALTLLVLVFPWLRQAFWLFTGDYFRTLSLFVTIGLLLAAAHTLDAILRERRLDLRVLAGTLLALLVPLYSIGGRLGAEPRLRLLVTLLLVAHAALLVALTRGGLRGLGLAGLAILVPVELMTLSSPAVNGRPTVTAGEWESHSGYRDETLEALALTRARTPGFHRIEKSYSSSPAPGAGLNDAKVQGYFGTGSYYSFNPLNYIRFLGGLGVIDAKDPVQTNWATGLRTRFVLQTLASVRYWFYRGDYALVPMLAATYRPVGTFGDVTVLENQNFVPLGFGLARVVRESAFDSLEATRKDVTLLHAVVIPDGDATAVSRFPAFDPHSLTLPYTLTAYADDARRCAADSMTLTRFEANAIEGNVRADSATIRVFSFPFDAGWSATLDGRPAPLARIDLGLTGLAVPAGEHVIRLDYQPPLVRLGAWLSLIGAVGLAALIVVTRAKRSEARAEAG